MQHTLTEFTARVFEERFGESGEQRLAIAPGRVNLIGEHTDYNDGFVLPMAIERYVAVAVKRVSGGDVRVWSEHFQETATFTPDALEPGSVTGWAAYPAGMCWAMRQRGHRLTGMEAAVAADIPIGAGVSSSAALEVSFGLALSETNGLNLDPSEIAEIAHVADNEFVGIPSGIMDQFASAMCRKGHALLIDCRTRASEPVPIPDHVVFVVMDTGRRRGLVDSEYADRVAACRRVAEAVRALRPDVTALRDATYDDLAAVRSRVGETDHRRATHVINENGRTLEACSRLRMGDAAGFGALMVQSHESLRDLYEVSCLELDVAVELALGHEGCLGARMTGGGFGGCAIAMVAAGAAEDFVASVAPKYAERTTFDGTFFPVKPAGGVRVASQFSMNKSEG
ncbi:MAG TPA: galactokinase [Rhodothermales bacterium]|nr:galactokinase [Rhodothermales bacterium]